MLDLLKTCYLEIEDWQALLQIGCWSKARKIPKHLSSITSTQAARGSVGLLAAADQIMAELDDFSLHPVRAQLADEMLSLRALGETDLQGLFLRIEALA